MNSQQHRPHGLWTSPIRASHISQRLRLEDVQFSADGQSMVWREVNNGVGSLYARSGVEGRLALTAGENVRAGVGYGGGDFTTFAGGVLFVERSGQLYLKQSGYGSARPLTPPFGSFAAPAASADGRWVVSVHSDGHTDVLAIVDSTGQSWPQKLASGADFYMDPAWHPAGSRLAWVEWDHPNMPWNGARLVLAQLEGSPPRVASRRVLAGGDGAPVVQPRFSPDGRWLSYIIARGEWEQLVLYDLDSGGERALVSGEGITLSQPAWVQGSRSYAWRFDSQALYHTRFTPAGAELWLAPLDGSPAQQVDVAPYTWIDKLAASPVEDALAFVASAPHIPTRVLRLQRGQAQVVARSEAEQIPPEYLPAPRVVTWQAPDGVTVYGLFYPPHHPRFQFEGLPPAFISIHSGPTGSAAVQYNPEAAYFTSRGYAYLEVNYRGSTGFGRSYMQSLRHRWGQVDVEDAAGAADMLERQQLADGSRLVITGSSAGGYTVLNALIRYPGRFKAGICRYGVSNLFSLSMDTHKFEAHYNDWLVGELPEAAQRYHDWSPEFHAARIQDPLAIFQGSDDPIVPPAQSEAIVKALAAGGIPHLYRLYAGEGHSFRKSETIADYLQQVERFLQQHVLFAP